MANTKISALADIVTLAAGDKVPVADASDLTATKSATMTEITTYVAGAQTTYVGTTAIALNRASASQGLTGITSIDGSAATLTNARNIGGRSFNGSADIVAPTFKTGITTRDITTASGTVNVAHGLGRVPSVVRVRASLISSAGVTQECYGVYDGTNHSGMSSIYSEGTTTATSDTIYTSTSFELGFSAATVVNPYTGANRQTATITVDSTNIIFTWTKTGTVASATANILWECC